MKNKTYREEQLIKIFTVLGEAIQKEITGTYSEPRFLAIATDGTYIFSYNSDLDYAIDIESEEQLFNLMVEDLLLIKYACDYDFKDINYADLTSLQKNQFLKELEPLREKLPDFDHFIEAFLEAETCQTQK